MFREMRRARQMLPEAECIEILRGGQTGILGVNGDDGYPYTVPINYVYEGGCIYIHGARSGHKLDAMNRDDRVSFCVIERDDVVPETLSTNYRSVILFGRARVLEGDEMIEAARRLGLKYCPDPDAVEREIRRELPALCCVEIRIEHMTGKEGKALRDQREAEQEK